MSWLETVKDGILIRIQAQPKASRSEVVGVHGDRLKIRIAAPPVDGAANEELVRLLAETLGVPRKAIRIVSGQTGRRKVVEVEGLTAGEVAGKLRLT